MTSERIAELERICDEASHIFCGQERFLLQAGVALPEVLAALKSSSEYVSELRHGLEDAIRREREICAKIAEHYGQAEVAGHIRRLNSQY